MSAGGQWHRLRERAAAAKARWFPERQIILRERDRLHALRLAPDLQLGVAGLAMLGLLWCAYASIGYLVTETMLARSQDEIEKTRIAYHELIDEVAAQHSKVLGITRDLEHYRSYLLTMVEQNETLQLDVRSFATQLESVEAERNRVADTEIALRGQLHVMERELAGVSDRNENLQIDVGNMRSRIAASEDERARFAAVRAALDRRLSKLEQDLNGSQTRIGELERAAVARQQAVDQAVAARRLAISERDAAVQKAADAERSMKTMAATHQQALQKLTDQTRNSIVEVERIVSAAGVDAKRLVPQRESTSRAQPGRGGPFVPWRQGADAPAAETSEHVTAALHVDIERLDQLRNLLRALPLAAPLRDFTIGSGFGRRVDPFNGQAAMHEGLDMSAPRGTRIHAAAPGKVIFAGWRANYGRVVEIEHGYGFVTRYAHLDKIAMMEGERVAIRQEIGQVGTSGRSNSPHLHYEVLVNGKPQNPANFLKATVNVLKTR